ncbi:PAS domain S-box protein [uncultured Desulfosarcina sp.]|uniref:PAS domain S-box protein n=1 Tax=uncultured Desulfosarcina sp. TaxID=218289 RepID=UPI0029C86579|nr:PAS domain S-box protein [uncultured Desulfosarcina sp.]
MTAPLSREALEKRVKRLESELSRTRRFHFDLLNNIPYPIFVKDEGQRWLMANDAYCTATGYGREELIGKTARDLPSPEKSKDSKTVSDVAAMQARTSTFEDRYGKTCTVSIASDTATPQPGKERDSADLAFSLNLDRVDRPILSPRDLDHFDYIQQATRIGSWEWHIESGRLNCSHQAESLLGKSKGTFGGTFDDLLGCVHPDDHNKVKAVKAACISGVKKYSLDHRVVWPDGTVRWLAVAGNVFRDDGGNAIRMLGIVQDITDRKRAEAQFAESETKYAALANNMRAGVTIVTDGVLSFANPALIAMLGYSHDELVGSDLLKLVAPKSRKLVAKRYADRMEGKHVPYNYEIELLTKDGRQFPVELDAKRININNHFCDLIIVRDISERRHAEANLRESEERFRIIFEQAAVGVALTDSTTGAFVRVNQKYADIVGYTVGELLQLSVAQTTHPRDIDDDLTKRKMLLSGQINSFTIDKRFVHKDGSIIWGRLTVSPMWNKGETPNYHIAILEDITERKRLKNELADKTALLEAVIKQSVYPICVVDAVDQIIIYANSAAIEQLGLEHKNYTGQHVSECRTKNTYYLPDHTKLKKEEWPIFKALKEIPTTRQELIVKDADGTIRWESVTAIPIYNDDGVFIAAFNIFPDITQRKRWEDEIRTSEERYRSIMEASPDPTVTYDMQGNVLFVNPAFTRVFGWTQEDLAGKNIDYVPKEVWPETRKMLDKLIRGEGFLGWQTKRYDKNRNIVDIDMSAGVWKDRSGKPLGSVVILRDVTRQKKIRMQLQQAQKMESIGVLAGGIAHDFNNILAAIIGYSELSIAMESDSQIKGYLEKLLQAGNRAKELVQQILSFSRATDSNKANINVTPIVKEVLKLLRATIPTTIEIYDFLNATEDRIFGDATQIHQILMNLCTNANHAMRNDKSGKLEVRLENVSLQSETVMGLFMLKAGKYIQLSVTDSGHGIPADKLEKVFDPYFTTKPKNEGTGLGLSIIHGIIKDYSGGISVSSEVGVGTRFEIFIPVSTIQSLSEEEETPYDLTGTESILLLDDEKDLVEAYGEILAGLGYTVTKAFNSENALELFRNSPNQFDLVVTDFTMPHMAGDALALELLKIRPDIPVIIVSGYSDKINAEMAIKMGFKAFAHKPVSRNELSKMVRKALDEAKVLEPS